MAIVTDIDREALDGFVRSRGHGSFLQSWDWGAFQSSLGNQVFRLADKVDGNIVSTAMFIRKSLPFGLSYLYAPRIDFGIRDQGPGIRPIKTQSEFIQEILLFAKKENAVFIRIDPVEELNIQNSKFKIQKTIDVQPSQTLVLDLAPGDEKILGQMRPKTRYNIRLAQKKGVRVRRAGPPDFARYWQVMAETEKRDGFRLHRRSYYEKMLAIPWIELLLAEHGGRILAGNIVSFFGDTATYIHGASSNDDRHLMAPYALQWEAVKMARARGLKYYDFHGIDEGKWPGVTRFKLGFGGQRVVYPGTFDLVVDGRRYALYRVLRKLRRLF